MWSFQPAVHEPVEVALIAWASRRPSRGSWTTEAPSTIARSCRSDYPGPTSRHLQLARNLRAPGQATTEVETVGRYRPSTFNTLKSQTRRR